MPLPDKKGRIMEILKRSVTGRIPWRLFALVVAAMYFTGCASMKTGAGDAEQARTIWKVREQFVNVVPQEREAGNPAVANDHPADLSPGELRRILASVEVLLPGMDAPLPLFSDTELKVLEDSGTKALRQANPNEDVTFAVFGYHAALQGLLKQTKVTTGRMFFQEGKLNLILGIVQRDVMETEDRRLNPFTPGSRLRPSDVSATFRAAVAGVPFTVRRSDWLVFAPLGSIPAVETVKPRPEPVPPAAVQPVPSQEKGATVERPVPATAPAPRSLEERLIMLKNLKDKGLITDDEFRAKRSKILDEL